MKKRALGRTGLQVSEIGLGCEHLVGMEAEKIKSILDAAIDSDINIIDVFMPEPQVRDDIGEALKGRREKVHIQGHIGSCWRDGQYERSRDRAECAVAFDDLLKRLHTDYIDLAMLHFVDTQSDLEKLYQGGAVELARELKASGKARFIGASSHDPIAARKLVEDGIVDMLMFSVNAAYDILPPDVVIDDLFIQKTYDTQESFTIAPARAELYALCEARGVGITVMKTLAAGMLLKAEASPFGVAMTAEQCIHYALTRPAVASVMIGCRTPEEVRAAVAYEDADEHSRDYAAALHNLPKFSMRGKCMYCNHCLPCPKHIDVAQVNKYLDLAELAGSVPQTVRAHYDALNAHGGDCLACRSCEKNCPFGVEVVSRMARAKEVFGR